MKNLKMNARSKDEKKPQNNPKETPRSKEANKPEKNAQENRKKFDE